MGASLWRFGKIQFDELKGKLTVNGIAVDLDRSSLAILSLLLRQADASIDKDQLLETGWPGRIVHENSLAKAIGRLRHALGEEGKRIEAVYGSGYRLGGPVEESPAIADAVTQKSVAPTDGRDHFLHRLTPRFGGRHWALNLSAALLLCASLSTAIIAVIRLQQAKERTAIHEQQAEALLTFLSSDLLAPADPYASTGNNASLTQVVERSAASIDTRFRNNPATRIMLHRAVANAFSGWGEYEKAVMHLDRARAVATTLYGDRLARENVPIDIALCQNMRLAGETRQAEPVCARAEQVAEQTQAPQLAAAHIVRAKLLFEIGQYEPAAAALAAALSRPGGISARERADAEWFHGLSLRKLGRFELADGAFRRHLTMRHTIHGDNHPLTAWAYSDYGDFLVDVGDFPKAQHHLGFAQRVFGATLGDDHPEALSPAYSMAIAHLWRGEAGAARDLLRPILTRYRETLGADHFWTLYTMTELALAEAELGEQAPAEALLREARQTGARILYGRDAKAVHFHMRWARALAALGKADDAEDETRRARKAMDNAGFAPDHPWRARLHCLGARSAMARGDGAKQQSAARACLSALGAVDALPASYPSLIEAKKLMSTDIS